MSSFYAPKTPASMPPGRAVLHRSFTVPPKLSTPTKQPSVEIGAADGIETLYIHPAARVVSFSTSNTPSRPNGGSTRALSGAGRGSGGDTVGTLTWATSTERTLAAGPLEIYRVPGSVSFLHSGSLLHAILPRSQCWCVDGVSKFAFRVLPETYYRIELPAETDEDEALVEQLKVTLRKVLYYEKTACPFKRGFTVELPDTPEKPVLRRKRLSTGPAKRWKLDRVWRPEDGSDQDSGDSRTGSLDASDDDTQHGSAYNNAEREHQRKDAASDTSQQSVVASVTSVRPSNLSNLRSVTAPPQLSFMLSPPHKHAPVFGLDSANRDLVPEQVEEKIADAPQTHVLPPTPDSMLEADVEPFSGPSKLIVLENSLHNGHESEIGKPKRPLQVTRRHSPGEDDPFHESSSQPPPREPRPADDSDSEEDCYQDIDSPAETFHLRYRRVTPLQKPGPRAETSTRVYESASTDSKRALSERVMATTCAIFLGPPSNLVSLMLRIAAKIANGALAFTIPSPEHSRKRVPGSWDLSEDEDEDEWDIGDYGFPFEDLNALTPGVAALGKAWQIGHSPDQE